MRLHEKRGPTHPKTSGQRREGFWGVCKPPIFRVFQTRRMGQARPASSCRISKFPQPPIFTEKKSFTALTSGRTSGSILPPDPTKIATSGERSITPHHTTSISLTPCRYSVFSWLPCEPCSFFCSITALTADSMSAVEAVNVAVNESPRQCMSTHP